MFHLKHLRHLFRVQRADGLKPGDALGGVEDNALGVGADAVEGDAVRDVDVAQVCPPFRDANLEQESTWNKHKIDYIASIEAVKLRLQETSRVVGGNTQKSNSKLSWSGSRHYREISEAGAAVRCQLSHQNFQKHNDKQVGRSDRIK